MEKIEQIFSKEGVKEILYRVDELFIPKISERKNNFDEYAKKLADNAKIYQIETEKKFIGMIAFYINKETKISYLTLLAIKNEYQGLGFGKKLLKLFEKFSKQDKIEFLKLEVSSKNLKAMNLYKSFGFEIFENSSDTSYYMLKKINQGESDE